MDYYQLLGVDEKASLHDIKKAFRAKAFDHHPDARGRQGKDAGPDSGAQFQKVLQAYETLRDPAKRAQYDSLRRTRFDFDAAAHDAPAWGRARPHSRSPTANEWERQFDEWIRRMEENYGGHAAQEAERLKRERMATERLRNWEREKTEAQEVKQRSERLKRRAEDARHSRQAATLRRFWQGRTGFVWQDAAVGVAFLWISAGLALQWRDKILKLPRA